MTMVQTTARPRKRSVAILIGLALAIAGCSSERDQPLAAEGEINLSDALAYRDGNPVIEILEPQNGAMVTSPLKIQVATDNLTLSPSGRTRDGEGHLHVLIDQECLQPGTVIPTDSETIHVGNGTGIKELELSPGHHDLCLQIGDGFHIAVSVAERLSVFVFEPMAWPGEVVSSDLNRAASGIE